MSTPTLSGLRDAVKATIGTAVPTLTVYSTVPDSVILPCVIVRPVTAGYAHTRGDPYDRWAFDLYVLTSRGEIGLGQDALDAYVSSAGASSIRCAIQRTMNLGIPGPDTTVRAQVVSMSDYGAQFEAASVEHVGAVLRLLVDVRAPL